MVKENVKTTWLLVIIAIVVAMFSFAFFKNNSKVFADDVSFWDGVSISDNLVGSGTETDPYKISSANDLAFLACSIDTDTQNKYNNKYYIQTTDIDLQNNVFGGIGKDANGAITINYNGLGHGIKNLSIIDTNSQFGLFNNITDSTIQNLHLTDVSVNVNINQNKDFNFGVFLSNVDNSVIKNCYIDTVSEIVSISGASNINIGAFAGQLENSSVLDSFARNIDISINTNCYKLRAGGFVGSANGCQISTCFVRAEIQITSQSGLLSLGGFAGESNSAIKNCYAQIPNGFNIQNISNFAGASIGGFVGIINDAKNILCCYVVTTFSNLNYNSTNTGLFAGEATDNSDIFDKCYVVDTSITFMDNAGHLLYDASNILSASTKLGFGYYNLSNYVGFNSLVWHNNQNESKYPELIGVGNNFYEQYDVKLEDSFGNVKGYFNDFETALQNAESDDVLCVLKDQITLSNVNVSKSLSITSKLPTCVTLNLNVTQSLFSISNNAILNIYGEISFDGGQNSGVSFAEGAGSEQIKLMGVNISNFNSTTLIENLMVYLENTFVQNNNVQLVIDAENVVLKNVKIIQNSSQSIIYIKNTLTVYGYGNLIDSVLKLDKSNNSNSKIVRLELDENHSSISQSRIQIMPYQNLADWCIDDVLVEANENLRFDDLTYELIGSPKINNTNLDQFVAKANGTQLLVGGVLFDIQYFSNENGIYERYYGKDKNLNDLPKYYEYGSIIQFESLAKIGLTFVGWFGYNEKSFEFYDINGNEYQSIFDANLTDEKSLNAMNADLLSKISYYETANQNDGTATYGKVVFYAKWQYTFSVVMQEEIENSGEYQFVESTNSGSLSLDDVLNVSLESRVSKAVFVGKKIKLTASTKENYTFIGWWIENEDNYQKFSQYSFNETLGQYVLEIENLSSSISTLYARFVYNAYVLDLQKVLKDENNSLESSSIFDNMEYVLSATLSKDGVDYTGKQYLNLFGNELLLRMNEKISITLDPGDYHFDTSNDKKIKADSIQNDLFPDYDFNELLYTLTIENKVGSGYGNLTIYFEKNYSLVTLKFGSNADMDNFLGGEVEIAESYLVGDKTYQSIFNHKINQSNSYGQTVTNSHTANIYVGTDLYLYFSAGDGYRLDITSSNFKYLDGTNLSFTPILENEKIIGAVVNNVIRDIRVHIHFIKTYNIELSVSDLTIEDVAMKIGEIKVESDEWTNEEITKVVDESHSLYFKTQQTDCLESYTFLRWKVTSDGHDIDASDIGLSMADLKSKEINLQNIHRNLKFVALYNKANVTVSIIWNGRNGQIAQIGGNNLGNDKFEVEYNTDIMFTIMPKNSMYFIKTLESETENTDAILETQEDGSTNYTIKNVTQNTRIILSIVPNTWWEHLTETGLVGDGTKSKPYLIRTPSELALISYFVNNNIKASSGKTNYNTAYYKLINNINLGTDYYFIPIGTQNRQFNGTFDYSYNSIKNIITEPDAYLIDNLLFYVIGPDGKIINQYRSNLPIILSMVGIVVIIISSVLIVYRIEKKRKKPKKVIILTEDLENMVNKK